MIMHVNLYCRLCYNDSGTPIIFNLRFSLIWNPHFFTSWNYDGALCVKNV